jgi:hypothetical protein
MANPYTKCVLVPPIPDELLRDDQRETLAAFFESPYSSAFAKDKGWRYYSQEYTQGPLTTYKDGTEVELTE